MLISGHYRSLTLETLFNSCQTLSQLKQIHAQTITSGLIRLDLSQNYSILPKILFAVTSISSSSRSTSSSSCSKHILSYANLIFCFIQNPSTFSFNTIIRANTIHASPLSALSLYTQMRRRSVPPDFHSFPFVFKACATQTRKLELAQMLHGQALRFGFLADLYVLNSLIHVYYSMNKISEAYKVFDESSHRDVVTYNVLIDGFVKSGELTRARTLFDSMPLRDNVSWNTLVAGYAQMSRWKEAIELFNEMISLDLEPDNVALVSVLSACAKLGGLEQGKDIHNYIKRNRIHIDSFLSTGLVDFYSKCGFIDSAVEIFESSSDKSLFTWNAMLVGLGMHGHSELALDYFSKMIKSSVKPDGISFLAVLVGCSHSGLVHVAIYLFDEMESVYGVRRESKHYGCMADLLGRAGMIEEAMEMIKKMPTGDNDVSVWTGLLGGCRIHGNVEIAEKAVGYVMALKPDDGGVYKMMADVYAKAERWEDVNRVRRLMARNKLVKKNAGCSLIVIEGFTHEFVAGDDLHPQTSEIYLVLDQIRQHQPEAW